MFNKVQFVQAIAIFAALATAGIVLLVFGSTAAPQEARSVLPLVGASLFSSGLTFFLVQVTRLKA